MTTAMVALLAGALVAVLTLALRRLRRDEQAVQRLRRSEYEPLVRHIWHQ